MIPSPIHTTNRKYALYLSIAAIIFLLLGIAIGEARREYREEQAALVVSQDTLLNSGDISKSLERK